MTTRLVVTADDVALHPGMTAGAVEAHLHGIVTACSVAGNGPSLDDAVRALRGCPRLEPGAHLVLVEGRPLRPPSTIASLVEPGGALLSGHRAFVGRYVLGRITMEHVAAECRAQIERLLGLGLALTHVNSHQHLHALPRVHEVVLRLADEFRIPYVRTPLETAPGRASHSRSIALRVLGAMARRTQRSTRRHGLSTNDVALGIADAGRLDPHVLRTLLVSRTGVAELVAHPGRNGAAIAREYGWSYEWERETDALCDARLPSWLGEQGFVLVPPSRAVAA